jgi:predicted alpha/beta superfamily hydrolase
MRLRFYSLLVVTLFTTSTFAQVIKEEAITIGTKLTIHSNTLNENRNILVYKPSDFDASKKYQVIYLFDAEYLFTSTVGIVKALVNSRKIPPSIIVGVETTIRVRDYLPPIDGDPKNNHQLWIKNKFPQFGGTKNFSKFLESELFPYIEDAYQVLPNRTMIGYSNAGVFGLHTLVTSPNIFTNFLLISPAAWWGDNEIDENLATFSKAYNNFSGNLFLTVANEGRGMYSNALRIASKLEEVAPASFTWGFNQFENETHESTIYPSIYEGLVKLFDDLNFKVTDNHGKYASIIDIQNYYSSLSKRYKYEILIPEIVLSDLADGQFLNQRNSEAIETLKKFTVLYPKSSFSHSNLGSGYMRTKQFSFAKSHFEKALEIVKKKNITDHSVIDYLQDMVAAAESKI